MPNYLLLLHRTPSRELADGELRAFIDEFNRWLAERRAAGQLVTNERLATSGRTIRSDDGRVRVSDGPHVEAKELIAGFILLAVRDYDAATELASTCPFLRIGIVEVREVAAHT